MTQFASDAFTATNGTKVVDRASDSGHSWVVSGISTTPGSTQTPYIISNEGKSQLSSGETYALYLNAAPPSADYTVTVDVKFGGDGTTDLTGPGARVTASSTASTSHGYFLTISPQNSGFRLRRFDAAVSSALVNITGTITAGVTYRMTIGASGSTISGKVQRLSDNYWLNSSGTWQVSEVNCCSVTDTTYSAAGRPAVVTYGASSLSTFDNFSADYTASDTTAPTLTGPTGTSTGSTTASGSVSTDEANGTLYYLASTNASESAATVKAASSQAVSATGAQSVGFTGLTASTTYYLHFVHRDAAGNDSAVASSASFTTSAAGDTTPPTLSSPTATATGTTTASVSVSTNEANGTLYRYVSTNASESAATIKASGTTATVTATGAQSASLTGLSPGTTYYCHWVHRDTAGNDSAVSSSASFTTTAVTATITSQPLTRIGGYQPGARTLSWLSIVNGTTGALVLTLTSVSVNSSGIFSVTDAALVAGTLYQLQWKEADGTRGCGWGSAA